MAYSFSRTVTFDHTKVPNTDQTNFPVLFSGAYRFLATVANSGQVTSASGFDIIFTSDAAGLTKLDHEIEKYDPTTGTVIFWIRIPTLSHTADTVIYIWYGDPSVIASQENKTGVWDANFAAVYHLGDGTTLSVADSTSNARNGTNAGTATATTGQIGGGASFDGAAKYYSTNYAPTITTAQDFTIEGWFNIATGVFGRLLGDINSAADLLVVESNNWAVDQLSFWVRDNGQTDPEHVESGHATDCDSTWHRFAAKIDHTAHQIKLKVDANAEQAVAYNPTTSIIPSNLFVGARNNGAGTPLSFLAGALDEIRFSTSLRSTDWTDTAYANESNPEAFYAVGAEQIFPKGGSPFDARFRFRPSNFVSGTSTLGQKRAAWSDDARDGGLRDTIADNGSRIF